MPRRLTPPSPSIGLYVLASQLEMPAAKNCIMDTIFHYYAEDAPELRCPSVADLRMVMDNLPEDSLLERLLIAHLVFTVFSPKRANAPVPDDWVLLRDSGRIGHGMVSMLVDWKWQLGHNVPPMKIRDRHNFHEKVDVPAAGSRSQIRVVIKAEPGVGDDSNLASSAAAAHPPREAVAEVDNSALARVAKRQFADVDGGKGPGSSAAAANVRPAKRPANRKGAAVRAAAAAAVARNPGTGAAQVHQANGSSSDPISL